MQGKIIVNKMVNCNSAKASVAEQDYEVRFPRSGFIFRNASGRDFQF
jgi:hypothetical protein